MSVLSFARGLDSRFRGSGRKAFGIGRRLAHAAPLWIGFRPGGVCYALALLLFRHSRESGNPCRVSVRSIAEWTPAFAGVTTNFGCREARGPW